MTHTPFFDLLEPGTRLELGSHTFNKDEIIRFAKKFDPQPFHLNDEAAKQRLFGNLCASGWHTASIWMRKNIENSRQELLKHSGYEGPEPVFGPSPGIRNLKWLLPVYVGDTISYSSTLTEKRKNPNRPGWGMLLNHSQGFNQDGKLVLSMDGAVTLRTD